MKTVNLKAKTSYGDHADIKFIYNDTTVICTIKDTFGYTHKGVAKLYPGDDYDAKKGEKIAFDKAREKLFSFREALHEREFNEEIKRLIIEEFCITRRFNNMQKKFYKN
jgi:hypothetical protein